MCLAVVAMSNLAFFSSVLFFPRQDNCLRLCFTFTLSAVEYKSDPACASLSVSLSAMAAVELQSLCAGAALRLVRPCCDCGMWTGGFCENECFATQHIPSELWELNQRTPHCSNCWRRYGACHFCRGVHHCRPCAWGYRELALPEACLF